MRPISLSRVVETASYAQNSPVTTDILAHTLQTSLNRAKEIAEEMVNMQLLERTGDEYVATERSKELVKSVQHQDWLTIHRLLMNYSFYYELYSAIYRHEPISQNDLLKDLQSSPIHFNTATVAVLCDWGERLGSVQRNVFSGRYYAVLAHDEEFQKSFLEAYHQLNSHAGVFKKRHFVEIPRLRETLCERIGMPRSQFDTQLTELFFKNLGKIELSGAPITTHAKQSSKKVKSTTTLQFPQRLTITLSSDDFLKGISIQGKTYYSVAYHGGELHE
jgi:hypothetical protein